MDATAQTLFGATMKQHFAPALRREGMRGSGASFVLPSETHFALLGFQKSQFSDSEDVKFTVNLKVVRKNLWREVRESRPHFPVKPAPNTGYGSFEWFERIGRLLPGGEDKWWHLRVGEVNSATIDEVVETLRTVAVPALRERINETIR